uniref:Trichohyalin-plectin-homology domain-containing protein n=1 Tax=Malurus cyaneus samueli TaxID=2593467 RepID=A0A8C5UI31_9PASS
KEKNVLDGYFLPNETDLRQVIVFSKAEWERIQASTREAAHIDKKEQEEVHKAAREDQPNATLLIQQKLQAKKLREEKEEEERKLIDLEEAQFQAAKRKEAIERAKTYLGYQDDRMRHFHSALLLAEVLKERDAQIEFQKSKLIDSKKKEYEEEQRLFKEYILSEQEKVRQHYMNQRALHKDQLEQIKEREHRADLVKQENKKEQEKLEKLIQLHHLEIQREKEKKEEEKAGRRKLYHKIIKAIEKQKQMEEDDRIKAHFKAKEIIAQMTKKREAEMRRLIQERRDKVISELAEKMGKAMRMEGERLARDVARIEAEEEKKREEREAKQKAALESIAEYRATVVRNVAWARSPELVTLVPCISRLHQVSLLFPFLHQAENQARRQQEKQAELDYHAQRNALALSKEHEFQKYVKQVIESKSKTSHHLYPLLKLCKDARVLGNGHPFKKVKGCHVTSYSQKSPACISSMLVY